EPVGVGRPRPRLRRHLPPGRRPRRLGGAGGADPPRRPGPGEPPLPRLTEGAPPMPSPDGRVDLRSDTVTTPTPAMRRAMADAAGQLRPLHDREGTFGPAAVDAAAEGPAHHLPPLSLVALENTHMPAGGVPWAPAQVEAVAAAARRHGLPVHCDGARLFNAAVALDVDAAALAAPVDTVMFCLSKGLSAPVGSMLAGSADPIAAAR